MQPKGFRALAAPSTFFALAACSAAISDVPEAHEVAAAALTMPTNLVADPSFEAQATSTPSGAWQGGSTTTIESGASPPHGNKDAVI